MEVGSKRAFHQSHHDAPWSPFCLSPPFATPSQLPGFSLLVLELQLHLYWSGVPPKLLPVGTEPPLVLWLLVSRPWLPIRIFQTVQKTESTDPEAPKGLSDILSAQEISMMPNNKMIEAMQARSTPYAPKNCIGLNGRDPIQSRPTSAKWTPETGDKCIELVSIWHDILVQSVYLTPALAQSLKASFGPMQPDAAARRKVNCDLI